MTGPIEAEVSHLIQDAIADFLANNLGLSFFDPNDMKELSRFIRNRLAGRFGLEGSDATARPDHVVVVTDEMVSKARMLAHSYEKLSDEESTLTEGLREHADVHADRAYAYEERAERWRQAITDYLMSADPDGGRSATYGDTLPTITHDDRSLE